MSKTQPPADRPMPEPVAWRVKHPSEPGMIGHYPWTYIDGERRSVRERTEDVDNQRLFTAEQMWDYALALVRVAEPQWQPIKTAPKDGRSLLLGAFNLRGQWRTMRGEWMGQETIDEAWEEPKTGEPGWYETAVEADDIPNCWRIYPTHWMPLSSAPAA